MTIPSRIRTKKFWIVKLITTKLRMNEGINKTNDKTILSPFGFMKSLNVPILTTMNSLIYKSFYDFKLDFENFCN